VLQDFRKPFGYRKIWGALNSMKDINHAVLLNILILLCNTAFCIVLAFSLHYFLGTPFTSASAVLLLITLSVFQLSIVKIVDVNRH
jgi:uncharacterized membrane protein (DUF485 family)